MNGGGIARWMEMAKDQNRTTSLGAQILVVDDDQLIRDVTLRRLTSLGYRAIAAATGAEALEALASGADVDLLLTDIRMPGGLHGPALAKEARRLRPQIKVLFVSGAPDDTLLQDDADEDSVQLLLKPCTKAELAEKIREVLTDT
jgi:CheY-like chemotaxis protein